MRPVGSPYHVASTLRLTGGFCHADKTVARQGVNSPFPSCMCTHAGSGPSRVHRRLLQTCLGVELTSQMDSGLKDSLLSKYFYHPFLSVVEREERTLVLALHAYFHRFGNYNFLLSNTALLLSIDSILVVLFEYHVEP